MVTKYHSLRNGFSPNQIFIASATPKKRKSRFGIFPERVIFFFLSFLFCRCQFPSGALTGNLNVDHAMCVLSLNIINDKIFLLEWIWFYILGVLKNYANDLPFIYGSQIREQMSGPDPMYLHSNFSPKKLDFPPIKNTFQNFFDFCLPLFYATFQCGP